MFIAVGFVIHNLLERVEMPKELSMGSHVFLSVIFSGTLFLSLLTLHLQGKGFRWFSLVWSALLLLLNTVHLGETVVKEMAEVSQVTLLAFIFTANLLLLINIRRWLKAPAEE